MSCESLLGVKTASSLFHVYLYVIIFVILPGKVHHEKQVLGCILPLLYLFGQSLSYLIYGICWSG